MSSITSANAVYMLSISSLYVIPQQIQGFSADDIFSTDPLESAEVMMGVDGVLSAGFVYVPIKQSIMLQADSASNDIFDYWWTAQQQQKDIYFANATVTLISIGTKYQLTNGVLSTYPPIPDAGKTLKPRRYAITWERVTPSPTA